MQNNGTPHKSHYIQVEIAKLKLAEYNPKGRVEPKALRPLISSIREMGLLYPILVDAKWNVIDGHRRIAACKYLGMKTIPYILVPAGPREKQYAAVNDTSRKMQARDAMGVWMDNPEAVANHRAAFFEKMEERIGRPMMKMIFDNLLSVRVYSAAIHICKQCEGDTDANVKQVIKWLVKYSCTSRACHALDAGTAPHLIWNAMKADKPLKISYGIGV